MIKKTASGFAAILAILFFYSCANPDMDPTKVFPQTTFDAPFPKSNKDLSNILGDKIVVKLDKDTFMLKITSTKNADYIVDEKDKDTVFVGTVCKYRGLYYFSHKINDTAYWIFAVKIRDKRIYGLNGALKETFCIDKQIEKGEHAALVKYTDKEKKVIRLHPDKKEIRAMLTAVMDTLKADTILATMHDKPVPADTAAITAAIDPEDYEFVNKVYPNPTKDELNVELQKQEILTYYLSDMTGKSVSKGEFKDSLNKISVSELPAGIYVLTLISPDNKKEESVKIVKE